MISHSLWMAAALMQTPGGYYIAVTALSPFSINQFTVSLLMQYHLGYAYEMLCEQNKVLRYIMF